MSDRDRFHDFAPWVGFAFCLLIIGIISFWGAYSKGYQRADKDHEADYAAHYAAQRDYEECLAEPTVEEAIGCTRDADHAYRENERAEQDLDAQREMADWAEGMLWATTALGVLSVTVTGIGVAYVALTLREARKTTRAAIRSTVQGRVANRANAAAVAESQRANDISKENFIADSRAWLDFKVKPSRPPKVTKADGIIFWVKVEITNYGRAPAHAVQVRTHAWPVNAYQIFLQPDRGRNWFLRSYDHIVRSSSLGRIVFPTQTITITSNITISIAEWNAVTKGAGDVPGLDKAIVHGTAKLYYRYSGNWAYTEKDFTLNKRDAEDGSVPFDDPIGDVPVEQLRIITGVRDKAT